MPPLEVPADPNYGSVKTLRGFRFARMKNGSLAVGVETVLTGNSAHLFSWGDASAGSVPMPDRVIYHWSYLVPTHAVNQD